MHSLNADGPRRYKLSRPRMRPLKIEFIGVLPTLFATCEHCMDVMHDTGMKPYSEQLEQYPKDVQEQYFELSETTQKLRGEFGDAVLFEPVDAASPQGIWLSMKHRIVKTPCVVIQGKKAFSRLPSYEELRASVADGLARMTRAA
jgi:hypothetical protein